MDRSYFIILQLVHLLVRQLYRRIVCLRIVYVAIGHRACVLYIADELLWQFILVRTVKCTNFLSDLAFCTKNDEMLIFAVWLILGGD